MVCTMYCDPTKNIFMFMPDGITDAEILAAAALAFPDREDAPIKPVGYVDLYSSHATYDLSNISPADFTVMIP